MNTSDPIYKIAAEHDLMKAVPKGVVDGVFTSIADAARDR